MSKSNNTINDKAHLSSIEKSIILTNKIALILLFLATLILVLNSIFLQSLNMNIRLSLMIFLSLSTLGLNKFQYNKLARHLVAGMPLFIILSLPLVMNDRMAEHDMVWYPYISIALSILPVIIFNPNKQIVAFLFWSILYLIMVLFIDRFIYISRNLTHTLVTYNHYALFKIPQIAVYLLINLAFYYIISTSRSFERIVEKQNESLKIDAEFIKKQSLEIAKKNELLEAKSREIEQINISLEKKVVHRTIELEKKNKQLMDYAFHNAHEVRGPLSKILGLTILLETNSIDHEKKDFVLNNIAKSANELDEVIKKINENLKVNSESLGI